MIAKLNSCAMATPTTNPGVVSYPNMTETRTKDQMRKPREKSSQVATSSLDSSLAPTIRRMLARAYLHKEGNCSFPTPVFPLSFLLLLWAF